MNALKIPTDPCFEIKRDRVNIKGKLAAIKISFLSLTLVSGIALSSTTTQKDADNEPVVCEHFRRALTQDKVVEKSRFQLCKYDFEKNKQNEDYFKRLRWKPVEGNLVSLTMKIFDADTLPPTIQPVDGNEKSRSDTYAWAQFQDQHNALAVDVVPLTISQWSRSTPAKQVQGYLLWAHGSYCDASSDFRGKRGGLIAFYEDMALTRPVPIGVGNNIYEHWVEPIGIRGGYYLMNNWYIGTEKGGRRSPVGKSYSMGLAKLSFSIDHKQIYITGVCGYNYFMEKN